MVIFKLNMIIFLTILLNISLIRLIFFIYKFVYLIHLFLFNHNNLNLNRKLKKISIKYEN